MSRKRRNTSSAESESPSPDRSRQTLQRIEYDISVDAARLPEQPRTNGGNSVTAAFPGLTDTDDPFYGPAQDGIDYLRMVRTEAKSIPYLLTAVVADGDHGHQEQEDYEYEGFFDNDEAFVADETSPDDKNYDIGREQELYYESILLRLNTIRLMLRKTPPLSAIQGLPAETPISFPALSKHAGEMWTSYMMQCAPHPVQVACMDSNSILELIRLVTRRLRIFLQTSADEQVQRFGTWVWAMLARCPERGQLGSDEISDLRACAKAADTAWQWLQNHTHNVAVNVQAEAEDDDTDEDIGTEGGSTMHVEANRSSVRSNIPQSDSPTQATSDADRSQIKKRQLMILDTIITVVGETYGQRDLLELRRSWNADDAG